MKPIIVLPNDEETGRRAFRMTPVQEDPVSLWIDDQPVVLQDLSANGVAFSSAHELEGKIHQACLRFALEDREVKILCQVHLLRMKSGAYAGELQDLSELEERLLSRFILACQKAAIKRERSCNNP